MARPLTALAGRRVLVMGLGSFGGGVGVARFLASQNARVTVTDTASSEQLHGSLEQLQDLPIAFKLGRHDMADFTHTDLLVTNPAIDKASSPFVQAALAAGVPITSEMNLFLERCPAFTIGITGSVGKSTTAMLTYLAVQAATAAPASRPAEAFFTPRVFLGGNIGKSLLADLDAIRPHDIVVLELSSFMLEDTPAIEWSPNVALLTNIFPNHLDRHGTLEAYAAAKLNILRFQTPADAAVLNADHPLVASWQTLARGQVVTFTTCHPDPLALLMPGAHNQANARAALAVLDALPGTYYVDAAAGKKALAAFPGLEHRLELVHISAPQTPREVRWYNDSKATTPEASITALQAFSPGHAVVIVGGYDKHIDLSAFEKLLATHAAGVLGIGQTGQAIVDRVKALSPRAGERLAYAHTLDRAVATAWEWISGASGPISAVLLSPASASWGQFTNYEQRGELFAQLARKYE